MTGNPISARMAHELPKPRDHQAFQRNCAVLFRAELNDPHVIEYGRNGQNQHGVDLVGRRDGRVEHHVGVQCRLIKKPIKYQKILDDCRAALAYPEKLKEILFATTAPDDTHAIDAAGDVEKLLRGEGHDVRVVVYGWDTLQNLIARSDAATAVFNPSSVATFDQQTLGVNSNDHALTQTVGALTNIVTQLEARLSSQQVLPPPAELASSTATSEDPALHARIDEFRDLFTVEGLPQLAERNLLKLLTSEDLASKPWAHFRVLANLGSIALDRGREVDAISYYEAAFIIRPTDGNALSYLALARTFQGRFDEAMDLAQQALRSTPRADHAVAYLLQAAARSEWVGEPETLVPADLAGNVAADIGLAEFYRYRRTERWEYRCLELADRHDLVPEFRPIRALAILSLAIESGETVFGGVGPVTDAQIRRSADEMKALAEHMLEVGFADEHDRMAHLSNTCVLLRLCGRGAEIEGLLLSSGPASALDPQLRRLLVLSILAAGRKKEAISILADDKDPENLMLRAELTSEDDSAAGLEQLLAVDASGFTERQNFLRWQLLGELSLKEKNYEAVEAAVAGLRSHDARNTTASIFELRAKLQTGMSEEEFGTQLAAFANELPPDAPMIDRYLVAVELADHGLAAEASLVLEGHVDLSRKTPATILFLRILAQARRDSAFRDYLNQASEEVRNTPEILWTLAIHAWNAGDLCSSERATSALLRNEGTNGAIHLFRLEILVRQGRLGEIISELEAPIEDFIWNRLKDQCRVVSLLAYFGYPERASKFAYRLFLENPNTPQAWTTLINLVLSDGRSGNTARSGWDVSCVCDDTAVNVLFDDGTNLFFVVEPDPGLRKIDRQSWEPEHALARSLTGLHKGDNLIAPDGRPGKVTDLRHKVIARFQDAIQNFQTRFPESLAIRSLSVSPGEPGGLDQLIEQTKVRHDWVQEQQQHYVRGGQLLGIFAASVGLDTIDAANGLASQDINLYVANGNEQERQRALLAVYKNGKRGCVLELHSFWTAWQLGALPTIEAVCGPIHVPQSVLDHLQARRERLQFSIREGQKSARYDDGKIVLEEIPPHVIAGWIGENDRALDWVRSQATVEAVLASDEIPQVLREHIKLGLSDTFDSFVVAVQKGILLVSDDLSLRELGRAIGYPGSSWTWHILEYALHSRVLSIETFIRWTSDLLRKKHSYVGVSAEALLKAVEMDYENGELLGPLTRSLGTAIGGRTADRGSHIQAVVGFLKLAWAKGGLRPCREHAASYLMRQLIRERHDDYAAIIRTVILSVARDQELVNFLRQWTRGHFIPDKGIWDNR